jgi:ABC-type dipeptide/oligopeptide/nickel transport system ATPase component
VQARVLDVFAELRDTLGHAFLLITHNLAFVERLCDEAAVLYGGRIIEAGPTASLLDNPQTDYTIRLIASVPTLDLE